VGRGYPFPPWEGYGEGVVDKLFTAL